MNINSDKIKLLYTQAGLHQYQLAEKAGVSRQSVNRALASGRCSPDTVLKLASALEVEVADLIHEKKGEV